MGKTRDIFKKIRDTKGTFYTRTGLIRKAMVWIKQKQTILREVARIHRKRYKKDLHDADNHNGVITHLEG